MKGYKVYATCWTKHFFAARHNVRMQFSMMGQQIFVSIKPDARNTHSTKVSELAASIIAFVDLTINFSVSGEFFEGGALKGFTLITQKKPVSSHQWAGRAGGSATCTLGHP